MTKTQVLQKAADVVAKYVPALAGAKVRYSRHARGFFVEIPDGSNPHYHASYREALVWLSCVAFYKDVRRWYSSEDFVGMVALAGVA